MGKRDEYELYDVTRDPLCIVNLADQPEYKNIIEAMEKEMTARLTAQGDPRMEGKGEVFDRYPNMSKSHQYYNRMLKGEKLPHNWINDSDFDPEMQTAE